MFHQGQKPAVDVGLSVSRVGGKTQAPLLREAAGTLRLDYAQFLELEVFTRFGGMPEGRVRQQLKRGARIREILKQPQHTPFRLADTVALMLAVQAGLLDPLPVDAVADFRARLPETLNRDAAKSVDAIAETGKLDDDARALLMTAMSDLVSSLSDTATETAPQTDPKAEAEAEAETEADADGIDIDETDAPSENADKQGDKP